MISDLTLFSSAHNNTVFTSFYSTNCPVFTIEITNTTLTCLINEQFGRKINSIKRTGHKKCEQVAMKVWSC